jgi:hypothetical protein
MSELGTQLRELFESKAPPLDLSQLVAAPVHSSRSRRRPLLTAVGVTVLVVLVGLASRALVRDEPLVPIIAPLPPSPVEPAPAPTIDPGSRLEWDVVDPGLDGPWTLVDGGDRFVVVGRRGELRESTDGLTWTELSGSLERGHLAAWEGTVLSWLPSQPGTGDVHLRLADGSVDRWFVPRLLGGAVGPSGVVVVASLSVEQATRAFGTDEIERSSDAWHTLDGQSWQPAEGFPSDVHELTIVGTPSGFYVAPRAGPPGEIWHSGDGRSWRSLPGAGDRPEAFGRWRELARWGEDAVLMSFTDEGLDYHRLTPSGAQLLFNVELAVETAPWLRTAAGPLGIVTVDLEGGQLVYSATGNGAHTGPLPDRLEGELVSTEVAMTDRAVLLVTDDPTDPRYGYGTADRIWAVARPVPPDHLP